MTNLSVTAGFNESKHQMIATQEDDGVALPNINGTRFGFMIKDATQSFNQVSLKARYYDAVDYMRDENVLTRLKAGEFGPTGHVMVSLDITGAVTFQVVADYIWWAAAPTNSVTVAIPIESGWAKDGSTVYLTNVAKRAYEKARETFLVYL